MNLIKWSEVDPAVTNFVFYQAERYLDAQFQSGVAADSRAITASSISVILATGALSAAAGLWIAKQPPATYIATAVLGGLFLIATYLCFLAAKPVNFYPSGNHPRQWVPALDMPINDAKGAEIENYQEMIDDNATALDASASWLNRGVMAPIASPFVAIIVFALVTSFS